MPFQPFGYRFEIQSPMPPDQIKAAIRSRRKDWLDSKNGARGWIAGPFICLWLSAFDRSGPMLFGRISGKELGTKITGRAGSDLNGLFLISLLLPVMTLFAVQVAAEEGLGSRSFLVLCGVLLLTPLIFWGSHKERRAADPLVRFVRDAVTPGGQAVRRKWAGVTIVKPVVMNVNGEDREGPVTPDAVYEALLHAGRGDFVILSTDADNYIQTAMRENGFVVEMRGGSELRHYRAVRNGVATTDGRRCDFTFDEALAALMAHVSEAPAPPSLKWEPMTLPS